MNQRGVGAVVNLVALPLGYGLFAYYVAANGLAPWAPEQAVAFAALVAVPFFVGGWVKFRDVWVNPFPKFGYDIAPMPPQHVLSLTVAVHVAVLVVTLFFFVLGSERTAEQCQAMNEGFKDEMRLAYARRYPSRHGLSDEEKEAIGSGIQERYKQAGFPLHDGTHNPNPLTTPTLILAGVVVLWSLYTPRQYGYHSGRPITTGANP